MDLPNTIRDQDPCSKDDATRLTVALIRVQPTTRRQSRAVLERRGPTSPARSGNLPRFQRAWIDEFPRKRRQVRCRSGSPTPGPRAPGSVVGTAWLAAAVRPAKLGSRRHWDSSIREQGLLGVLGQTLKSLAQTDQGDDPL